MHDTIDALCGYPVDFISNYEGDGIVLYKYMQKVLKDLMTVPADLESVADKLITDYSLPGPSGKVFSENFLIRRKDLQSAISATMLSENSLSTFNWSISMIKSSSNKADLKDIIMQLELVTQSGTNENATILEFNYPELCRFLEQINEVKERCIGY